MSALLTVLICLMVVLIITANPASSSRPGMIQKLRHRKDCLHHHKEGNRRRTYMQCLACGKRFPREARR